MLETVINFATRRQSRNLGWFVVSNETTEFRSIIFAPATSTFDQSLEGMARQSYHGIVVTAGIPHLRF